MSTSCWRSLPHPTPQRWKQRIELQPPRILFPLVKRSLRKPPNKRLCCTNQTELSGLCWVSTSKCGLCLPVSFFQVLYNCPDYTLVAMFFLFMAGLMAWYFMSLMVTALIWEPASYPPSSFFRGVYRCMVHTCCFFFLPQPTSRCALSSFLLFSLDVQGSEPGRHWFSSLYPPMRKKVKFIMVFMGYSDDFPPHVRGFVVLFFFCSPIWHSGVDVAFSWFAVFWIQGLSLQVWAPPHGGAHCFFQVTFRDIMVWG